MDSGAQIPTLSLTISGLLSLIEVVVCVQASERPNHGKEVDMSFARARA